MASASTLNFGDSSTSLTLVLSNIGKGDLELLNLSVSEPWLQIAAVNVDAGEACGAWLTVDQPIRIQLESDVSDLNFPVEYLVSLPTSTSTEQPSVASGKRRKVGN